MIELENTNFLHDQERSSPGIEADAMYTIIEPIVERANPDGSVERMDVDEVLDQMKAYVAEGLRIKPGNVVPFGNVWGHTVGEIIDTNSESFVEEVNHQSPVPPALLGILKTTAQIAERSGFDRDKAELTATVMQDSLSVNPNANVHADGLGGLVHSDTKKVKMVRFVYPMRPGTIIYPVIDIDGAVADVTYTGESGVTPINNPTPLQEVISPRVAEFTEGELIAGGAQQVLPGRILGFDPTRKFWHQAPEQAGPILVIDITQAE